MIGKGYSITWKFDGIDKETMDVLFPAVKPQWILSLPNTDFNTLSDDKKAEVIGSPFIIDDQTGKVLYRFRVIGIHENGGLIIELDDDK